MNNEKRLPALRGFLQLLLDGGELDGATKQTIDEHLKRAEHAMSVRNARRLRKELANVARLLQSGF